MWLRQSLTCLSTNLLGRLAVFVRWGPQDDEGESALPNPHSHSSQSQRSRRLRAGDAARLLQEFGETAGAGCHSVLWYSALVVASAVHAAGRLMRAGRVLEIGERFACLSHYSHDR